jgi:colanic acid biosynthesis glycosyl transferase WcaI
MKVIFFNRFFFPDTSATSQILSDLAFCLASANGDIHVVTSKVPGGDAGRETIRGVTVHRVTTAAVGSHNLMQRALAYFRYYRGARRAARELLEPGDIAVLKTDPPLLTIIVSPVARQKGAKVVAWIQDIFPEIAGEYGVPGMKGALGAMLRRKRNASLIKADRVVAIGPRMAERLAREGVTRERLTVIHNWADGDAITPVAIETNQLRQRWNLTGKFIVGYSGNLGRVHEFNTLLQAAHRLLPRSDIRFVIVGRGPRWSDTEDRAKRQGLSNVIFQPHQERSGLAESLGVADVHLAILQPRFDSLVLPSKIYGIMAAGRPLVFIGDPQGESADLISQAQCGISVPTGDDEALASAITRLADDAAERKCMGHRARAAFDGRFSTANAFAAWSNLLGELGYKSS